VHWLLLAFAISVACDNIDYLYAKSDSTKVDAGVGAYWWKETGFHAIF
jgi:hypothetical protein